MWYTHRLPPLDDIMPKVRRSHTVGSKGQIVIPKALRDAVGLRPGDGVEFELDGDSVRIVASGPVRARKGAIPGKRLAANLEADRHTEPR